MYFIFKTLASWKFWLLRRVLCREKRQGWNIYFFWEFFAYVFHMIKSAKYFSSPVSRNWDNSDIFCTKSMRILCKYFNIRPYNLLWFILLGLVFIHLEIVFYFLISASNDDFIKIIFFKLIFIYLCIIFDCNQKIIFSRFFYKNIAKKSDDIWNKFHILSITKTKIWKEEQEGNKENTKWNKKEKSISPWKENTGINRKSNTIRYASIV